MSIGTSQNDFSNVRSDVNALEWTRVQTPSKMEGSQFPSEESSAGEQEAGEILAHYRALHPDYTRDLLRCSEAFADEQEFEPHSPTMDRDRQTRQRSPPTIKRAHALAKHVRQAVAKRVRQASPPEEEEDDELRDGTPDLYVYLTEHRVPEPEMVKMLRALASYLCAKDPHNRQRYSKNSADTGTWQKRWKP